MMTTFRLGELFSGPGGLACGAVHARIEDPSFSIIHQWATDYDPDACATYTANICPDDPDSVHCADIREFDLSTLPPMDALAFGFPCNDFSMVGERKGLTGTYGPLYSYGVKALKTFRPQWFLAENVSGLQSANDGRAFRQILSELKGAGYTITPNLFRFEDYGVPQTRHRIIIVGIRDDLGVRYRVPSPEPYAHIDNSARHALEMPPIPADAPNNERSKQSEKVTRRLEHIRPGENAFTANLPDDLKLNISSVRMSQIYKRLDPDRPSYTVTGSGGGGTRMYHWSEPRALTNRERARIQTFPDDYRFVGGMESVRRQVGMAVPPMGAGIIFEAILRSFAGIDYPSVEPNIGKQ